MLAERIVSLSWRLRRAELMQNEAMDCMILRDVVADTDSELNRAYRKAYGISPEDSPDGKEYLALGRIATKRWSENHIRIERLFMHERRIESSLNRIITKLKKHQIIRRTERQDAEQQRAAQAAAAFGLDNDFAKQSQLLNSVDSRGRDALVTRGRDDRDTSGDCADDFVKQNLVARQEKTPICRACTG